MKIKDIIKILEITEGKLIQDQELETKRLPKDMYDEFNCTIHGVTKPLEELDFIHLVRSYKNKIRDLTDGYVSKEIYQMVFDKVEQLEKNANSKMVFKLEEEVSRLKSEVERYKSMKEGAENSMVEWRNNFNLLGDKHQQLKDENKRLNDRYIDAMYGDKTVGHKYCFAEIPNDDEGNALIKQMRQYVNTKGYHMVVRGQHLKEGEDWKDYPYGQPIDKSTHLRVYLHRKYEEK